MDKEQLKAELLGHPWWSDKLHELREALWDAFGLEEQDLVLEIILDYLSEEKENE